MRYPVAIHKDTDSCYGVSVPDIPGCFSAGETYDEALTNAEEAISSHLEILAEDGSIAPHPGTIEELKDNPDYADASWALADVDVAAFLGKSEKATVSLPKLLIEKIDDHVRAGGAKSRSAFLAESAISVLGLKVSRLDAVKMSDSRLAKRDASNC